MSIEDIILDHDRRGISALRPHLPEDYCTQAAQVVLDSPGTAVVVTGFYILAAGAAETDGPPGAAVIGNALQSLGYDVVYVTDQHAAPVMRSIAGPEHEVVTFPITGEAESRRYSKELLDRLDPSVIIAIERCGLTADARYRNMHGQDISAHNAKIDYLLSDDRPSVGIGDGGNEIGMGNLQAEIPTVPSLVKAPCVTRTTKLVISSVSNWGGYGLVAALSLLSGASLLPSVEEEQAILRRTVDAGAVDGMSTKQEYKVDGFTMEENSQTVQRLHDYVAQGPALSESDTQ